MNDGCWTLPVAVAQRVDQNFSFVVVTRKGICRRVDNSIRGKWGRSIEKSDCCIGTGSVVSRGVGSVDWKHIGSSSN